MKQSPQTLPLLLPVRRSLHALQVLIAVGSMAFTDFSQAGTISLVDLAQNSASGSSTNASHYFPGGWQGWEYITGNPGAQSNAFTLMKFDISSLQGQILSEASVTLTLSAVAYVGAVQSSTVKVDVIDQDIGSRAFVRSDISFSTTHAGSFAVDSTTPKGTNFTISLLPGLQAALARGDDYLAIKLNNPTSTTVAQNVFLVGFSNGLSRPEVPYLEYTVVPEPGALFLLGGVSIGWAVLRKRSRTVA